MINRNRSSLIRITSTIVATLAVTLAAKADLFIGPPNPGFENGGANWNTGASGGPGGLISFANSPTNGPSAPGTNCVLETSDGSGTADLRVDMFGLGAAAGGAAGVTVEFDYYILNPVNFGDQIRVGFRSLDSGGGFQGENNFHIGTPNGDAGGDGWHHFKGTATPSSTAVNADIRITMNVFGDDTWSSGDVLFDNFSVKLTPAIGTANPGFENGSQNWHTGGSGNSGNYISFANSPTNGPSAPGTNCVLETSDGSGQSDLRVDMFSLGAATQGSNSVSVEFDYNILGPVNFGDQIRVGFRSLDSGGGFQGEHNFHIGAPNNDPGANGWHHFHGVAVPSSTAVNGDIRISMNIFGDDTWSSGPVLFDNFSIKVTRVIGPNNNGDFEEAGANWHAGGPGGPGGSELFVNSPTNGPSAPGTNCVMMTADGSVTPSGGNDIRVNSFSLPLNGQPVTISFDYNILRPVNSGNQVRVGLRFFDSNNNFTGEFNSHIGAPNNDLGAQGWKHYTASTTPPSAARTSDIRISMNIFGDDIWSSGPVLFDNFVVTTGTNSVADKFLGIANAGGQTYTVTFSGVPDSEYVLEMAGSLNPPIHWVAQTTNLTDINGLLMSTRQQAGPIGFWRARLLP